MSPFPSISSFLRVIVFELQLERLLKREATVRELGVDRITKTLVDPRQTLKKNAGDAMMKPKNYRNRAVGYEVEESTLIDVENALTEVFLSPIQGYVTLREHDPYNV